MDFAVAPGIVDAVRAKTDQAIYGYHTGEGPFYAAMTDWVGRRHGWKLERDWLLHAPGVVSGLSAAILALTEPGDGIVIQPPVYPPFFSCVTKNRRRLLENPLRRVDGRYEMDLDALERLLDPGVKLLILCSPHNPVGRVWTEQELSALGQLCLQRNVTVLSDEIHCDLVLDGHRHLPFAALGQELAQNSVTFVSPSKTFNIAGTYTSAIVVPDAVKRAKIHDLLDALDIDAGNIFGLVASEAAYRSGEDWLNELLPYLTANAAVLADYVQANLPGVRMTAPEGTYLAWLDFRELFASQEELTAFLVHAAGVGLNAGRSFGREGEGFARLNFACPRSLLLQGLERIAAALKNTK
jgi:cystathionine beta-lyase